MIVIVIMIMVIVIVIIIMIKKTTNMNSNKYSPGTRAAASRAAAPWGNTNRVVSNQVVSKGPLYPSKTKININIMFVNIISNIINMIINL